MTPIKRGTARRLGLIKPGLVVWPTLETFLSGVAELQRLLSGASWAPPQRESDRPSVSEWTHKGFGSPGEQT